MTDDWLNTFERIKSEMANEAEAYRAEVAALPGHLQDRWAQVEEFYEWFDGEHSIAHATLIEWLKKEKLNA